MIEAKRENLCINRKIAEKKDIIFIEGDMIVPDSKPDILNTICTSGVVSIYKKEVQDGKVKIDGAINTYIMYMPDGVEDQVRGINTTIDFSENINVPNVQEGMDVEVGVKIKSIEAKVINGRKIGIKATLEIYTKVYSNENVEVINEIKDERKFQILKEDLIVNSLVGKGQTKISAKDNIQIDPIDNLAEILKVGVGVVDRDVKISYNKVLTKAEVEIRIMYLTEDNRINTINYKIPAVGFVDIQNVAEGNVCDVNYEIKNIIIKPNPQEEHSIYVEVEIDVTCSVYEEKQLKLIQDIYNPVENINFEKKTIATMTNKQNVKDRKEIREKVNIQGIEGMNLVDTDIDVVITNESKINSKILYEAEMIITFIFEDSRKQILLKDIKVPFEYTVENLQNGELLITSPNIDVKSKEFVVQDGGNVSCNIDLETNTDMYRTANINVIDNIEEAGPREKQDYSIVIYVVKKGDTLWNIAKEFGSTVDGIARVNGIENPDLIMPGQKLYIPKFERVLEENYE